MRNAVLADGPDETDQTAVLHSLSDRLRSAERGCPDLDQAVSKALAGQPAQSWTSDLGAALALLPPDCNFSLGRRDSICWAWVQPNDSWQPGEYEARHDHPDGSGLVVAPTAALALTASVVAFHAVRASRGATGSPVPLKLS